MPKRFIPRDAYARKAVETGYLARSAFKLEAIVEKFGVLKPGDSVLDLGAAPGSWLQVACEVIGPKGRAVGVDLNPIAFTADNVRTLTCDILAPESLRLIEPFGRFDVILSDAAPKTTGIRGHDQAQSLALAERAVEIAQSCLRQGGAMVVKVFESADTSRLQKRIEKLFRNVYRYKPPASRDRSYETYLVALHKR